MNDELFTRSFLSLLKRSQKIMVSTGAGISVESGAPTFRSTEGLWKDFKPEKLATPEAFAEDPKKVWEFYEWRRQKYKDMQPNAGHHALADLEKMVPEFSLFTQNVDGLHQKAGSKNVHELHGSIWRVKCIREEKVFPLLETPLKEIPPLCECGALLRPDVVWFGEPLPAHMIELAMQKASLCEVFFIIGTSATVQPAASLAWIAYENGAIVVEINPEETQATDIANESFRGAAGIILPLMVEALRNHNEENSSAH
jgi:NAD-dependent protein deacetylase/lipoamidase